MKNFIGIFKVSEESVITKCITSSLKDFVPSMTEIKCVKKPVS